MKPEKNMIWKVKIEWQGEQVIYETDGNVGKYIEFLKQAFKGCDVVERWQESC